MKLVVMMFFGLSAVLTDVAGDCEMAGFYQELGCTPVQNPRNTTGCPLAYNCPGYPDSKKCYYKGTAFSDGTSIPDAMIDHPCSLSCTCHSSYDGKMRFQCAAIDCMESFEWSGNQRNCFYTYDLNSCCSTGSICGDDEIAKLKTCVVDGVIYREGQTFWPKSSHKNCICTNQWNGSIEDPRYCKDLNCGLEIHYQGYLRNRCAVVFFSSRHSCPIYFKCPSSRTIVVRQVKSRKGGRRSRSGPLCIFGNTELNIGDRVSVDDQCTTCSCVVPPFVSCVKEMSCA